MSEIVSRPVDDRVVVDVTISPSLVLRAGVVIATLLVLATPLTRPFQSSQTLYRLLDVDAEQNVPSWYSGCQLLCVGLLLALVAQRAATRRRQWWVLALGLVYMSLDEVASLHEVLGDPTQRLIDPGHVHPLLTFAWVVPAVAAVGVLAVAYIPFLRDLEPVLRRRLLVAAALYLFGAVVLEAVGGALYVDEQHVPVSYITEALVEEWCEMVAMTYALWALLVHLGTMRRAGAVGQLARFAGGRSGYDARMGLDDKLKNAAENAQGEVKEHVGGATGNHDMQAEGLADQNKADLKQAGEKVKDVFTN